MPPANPVRACLPRPKIFQRISLVALIAAASLSAQTTTPPAAAPSSNEETVVLSPFEVNTSKDTGYYAQNTLSGTRLNTSVNDLGSAMTIFTPTVWNDLGVFNTNDMIVFTPGGEKNDTQQFEGNGGNLFWGDQTRFRGIQVENIVRNTFRTEVISDTYNADRFEFSRGPNAILFGVGDGTALVNRTTQDAVLGRNSVELVNRIDNFGTFRNSLNFNRTLVPQKLALRVALLDSDEQRWLEPVDYQRQKRIYLAGQYRLTDQLTLKANYEYFQSERSATAGNIPFDGITPWEAAGRPTRASITGVTPVNPAGISTFSGTQTLMLVYGADGATPQLQDWVNRAIGANPAVLGTSNVSLPLNYASRRFDLGGNSAIQDLSGGVVNSTLEYAVNKDLTIQLAVNDESVVYDFLSAAGSRLQVDASSTLADGSANPNAGRPFVVQTPSFRLRQDRYRRDRRLTASYHFDAGDKLGHTWLGVHDLAAMYEMDTSEHYWDVLSLRNTTPLPGASALLGHSSNQIRFVDYVDVANAKVFGMVSALSMQQEANRVAGVNAQWLPTGAPTAFKTVLSSQLYVLQSRFWDNRLVTTLGWRRDDIDKDVLLLSNVKPAFATGAGAAMSNYARSAAMTKDTATSALAPINKTYGGAFHLIRNKGVIDDLSATYNHSTTFSVTDFTRFVDGSDTPPQSGVTKDYGLRGTFFGNRLGVVGTVFESSVNNINDVRTESIYPIISDLMNMIGENRYVGLSQTRDIEDKVSKGWELQFTTNITKNWRVLGSASYYKTLNSNVGDFSGAFIDQWRSKWLVNPSMVVPNRTQTAQQAVDELTFQYALIKAGEGTRALNERRHKYVLMTNYSFSEGVLKGFSVGGNVVWQEEPVIGYAVKSVVNTNTGVTSFVPDATNPFFGATLMNVGLSAGYSHKVWKNKANWSIQLNVRNALKVDPFATRAGADSSAPTKAVVRLYSRGEPTVYSLTNTIRF